MQNERGRKGSIQSILNFAYERIDEACQYAEIECQSSEYQKHVIRPLSVMLHDIDLMKDREETVELQILASLGQHVLNITKLFEAYAKNIDSDDPDNDLESFEICSQLVWEIKNFIVNQFSKCIDEFGDFRRAKLGTADASDSDAWDLYLTKVLELYVKTHSE